MRSFNGHLKRQAAPRWLAGLLSWVFLLWCSGAVAQVATQPETVRDAALPTQEKPVSKAYQGEKISLNFQSVDVRAVLQVLADFSQFNIVCSDSVSGALTLRLKDVPWDQALDIILQARALDMRQSGQVLWVAPKAEFAARDRQELEIRQSVQTLEPLRTQNFRLNYARADDIARSLNAGLASNKILSPRGSVISEARTNQLFVTDTPARLVVVQALVHKLDIPVRQVMIEARIVEAGDTFSKSLGARLGGRPFASGGSPGAQAGASYIVPSIPVGREPVMGRDFGMTGADFVNLPAAGLNGLPASTFAISLFNASLTRVLNLELSALEADGKGKVVSSPRIVTADQVKALIEQGTELPYQQATSSGATAVTFRKANLKLEVTPQITPEGHLILNVDVNKDSVGRSTVNGFAIDTKHVQTQVLVENGGTVMIGGIFEQTERDDETRVPFFGSLPVLGHFFKSQSKSVSKSELLVFITPQLLSAPSAAPAAP
jgi:type IV pilus assembly protein PilQ